MKADAQAPEPDIDIPDPEVRARPATKDEINSSAMRVGKKARKNGFIVRATYARGPRMDAHWRVIEISESILVRGRHEDGRWFAAAWVTKTHLKGKSAGIADWEFDVGYVLDLETKMTPSCTVKPIEQYLVTTTSDKEVAT